MIYWVSDDDHKYKLEYFKEMIELPFENIRIQAPAMYDAVLKVEYGDYMKLARKGGQKDQGRHYCIDHLIRIGCYFRLCKPE